jgi:hypothetical protein
MDPRADETTVMLPGTQPRNVPSRLIGVAIEELGQAHSAHRSTRCRCTFTDRNVGRNMKVEDLIGHKVWVKSDQFRSVPGIISSVPKPVNLDDFASSVKESIFRIDIPSGDVLEVFGAQISKIDDAG